MYKSIIKYIWCRLILLILFIILLLTIRYYLYKVGVLIDPDLIQYYFEMYG